MSDTNRIYGYARISSPKQSIDRQIRNILQYDNSAKIFSEAYSGTKIVGRKEWQKLLKIINEGDTIIFDSVSRMSRNAEEGWETYQDLHNKKINLVFLKEQTISTSTYKTALENKIKVDVSTGDNDTDNFMKNVISAVNEYITSLQEKQIKLAFLQAEKEVQDLRQRTKEGLVTARLNGKKLGRPEGKFETKKSIEAKKIIKEHHKDFGVGNLNNAKTMTLAGISKMSFYKYKAEMLNELAG